MTDFVPGSFIPIHKFYSRVPLMLYFFSASAQGKIRSSVTIELLPVIRTLASCHLVTRAFSPLLLGWYDLLLGS